MTSFELRIYFFLYIVGPNIHPLVSKVYLSAQHLSPSFNGVFISSTFIPQSQLGTYQLNIHPPPLVSKVYLSAQHLSPSFNGVFISSTFIPQFQLGTYQLNFHPLALMMYLSAQHSGFKHQINLIENGLSKKVLLAKYDQLKDLLSPVWPFRFA